MVKYIYSKLLNNLFWLSGSVIIFTSLHHWPLDSTKIWKLINPASMGCVIGILVFITGLFFYDRAKLLSFLPHVSVVAYILINLLSLSFANSFIRSINYNLKLLIALGGMHILIGISARDIIRVKFLLRSVVTACIISMAGLIIFQHVIHDREFGFHGNIFKFSTYISIVGSVSVAHLLCGKNIYHLITGCVLGFAVMLLSKSVFVIITISVSLIATLLIYSKNIKKKIMMIAIIIVSVLIIRYDLIKTQLWIFESEYGDLKQYFLECQAYINILSDYFGFSSGAGCINDVRSKYYLLMPKLNTLDSYNQNGWLCVAGETGLLSLLSFSWIIVHHFCLMLRHKETTLAVAVQAGLISLVVANFYSSIHFSGNLFLLGLLTGLSQRINQLNGEENVI